MSDAAPVLATIQTTLDALSGGLAADEAGVGVLVDALTNVTNLLGAALARIAVLEAINAARVDAGLRRALHIPD